MLIRSICLYCGSNAGGDPVYAEAARTLGREAARRGVKLVYGGGSIGLMGAAADAALAGGGEVHGIIPEHLQRREVQNDAVTRMEVVGSMHERKMRMFDESDAFAILPGGLGTLDETFEILTWRQLGLHDKPVILVNVAGYWDALLAALGHMVRAGFVRPKHAALLSVVGRVEDLFPALELAPPPRPSDDIELA
ncbi:MAG: TIGR00730 family Rossman fold protein [Tistlia sp.]|uniref:TIGR00730 family Rossman fold protein n=1 Tax=Tistlia sp. TaxID=3057121 RepID=UPI0034A23660